MTKHELSGLSFAFLAAIVAAPVSATAQTRVAVSGVAYDSLHSRSLENALIGIAGTARSTMSDAHGRFRFDSVVPGNYTFTMQHDVLDSIGFSGISAKANVTDGRGEVRLAVPSFTTLWRFACGARPESPDSGLVFGTVRDAERGAVVSDASVEASWIDVTADKTSGVRQQRFRAQIQTDAKGGYGICGVPVGINVQLRASTKTSGSGLVELENPDARVQRMDLTTGAAAANVTGLVIGRVTGPAGQPIEGARVVIDTLPESRTLSTGQFVVRNVPVGSRQLEIQNIGMGAITRVVNVSATDTAFVSVQMQGVSTLATMRITAPEHVVQLVREIDERKKFGVGYVVDSTKFLNNHSLSGVFSSVPGVRLQNTSRSAIPRYVLLTQDPRGECAANLFIDGMKMRSTDLSILESEDIAVIEVYPRKAEVPPEFLVTQGSCGSVAVWTKQAFR